MDHSHEGIISEAAVQTRCFGSAGSTSGCASRFRQPACTPDSRVRSPGALPAVAFQAPRPASPRALEPGGRLSVKPRANVLVKGVRLFQEAHPTSLRLPKRSLRMVHSAFAHVCETPRCIMANHLSTKVQGDADSDSGGRPPMARLSTLPFLHRRSIASISGGAIPLGALAQGGFAQEMPLAQKFGWLHKKCQDGRRDES
jgi:hypothetical protein